LVNVESWAIFTSQSLSTFIHKVIVKLTLDGYICSQITIYMKHLHKCLFVLISLMTIYSAHAQVYIYTNDTSGLYNAVATNATGVKLIRKNSAIKPGTVCGLGFSTSGFKSVTTFADTLACVEASVTADAGYQLAVTGFNLSMRRSGSGPANIMLAYSIDGGTTWISKGTTDTAKNGSCGTTQASAWTTALTVTNPAGLLFRVYGYSATSTGGALQILNLTIAGTVVAAVAPDTIVTSAFAQAPACLGDTQAIAIPFTHTAASGTYYVQLSDSAGVFPSNATANIISAASTTSPIAAKFITSLSGTRYLVRVVSQSPAIFNSGDNGSYLVVKPNVVPVISIVANKSAICAGDSIIFDTLATKNSGTNASLAWFYNAAALSTNAHVVKTNLVDGDSVYCTLITTGGNCQSPLSVKSNVVHIKVYQPATSSRYDTICPNTTLTVGTKTYSATGVYTDTLQTTHGCDSILIIHLTVKSLKQTAIADSFCQGTTYVFNTKSITASGTYYDTLRCDSIVTLTLNYKGVKNTLVSAAICQGDTFVFAGKKLTVAGTFTDTVRCDSIVSLTLSFKTVINTAIAATICQGDTYTFAGKKLTAAGVFKDTVSCDSIVTLTLSYSTVKNTSIAASFCQGGTYTFGSKSLTTAGTYMDTVRCDSMVTLTLSYNTVKNTAVSASFCQGGTYAFGGKTLTTTGTFKDTVRCDSIVTLTLSYSTVKNTAVSASFCTGGTYAFGSKILTAAGTYKDTVRCDSIVTLTLTTKIAVVTNLSASVCQGNAYSFGGKILFASGTYTDTVRCDSIVKLVLTVNPKPTPVITVVHAGVNDTLSTGTFFSYQWIKNGINLSGATAKTYIAVSAPGRYTVWVTDVNGCKDSANAVTIKVTGIEEVSSSLHLRAMPNPFAEMITITLASINEPTTLTVVDAIGRVAMTQSLPAGTTSEQLDMSTIDKGIYLVTIHGKHGLLGTVRVVKE
jgi:hypothetical protein